MLRPALTFAWLLLWTVSSTGEEPCVREPEVPPSEEAEYLRAPIYDPGEQLEVGLAMAGLVVDGTPAVGDGGQILNVHAVLFGQIAADLRNDDGSLKLGIAARAAAGQRGVWMLVPSPSGYCSVNPEVVPLARDQFNGIRRPPEHWTDHKKLVVNKAFGHQMYHTYVDGDSGKTVWHGPDVTTNNGELTVSLLRHGERDVWVRWDRHGETVRAFRLAANGPGFSVDFHHGRLVEFRHYKNRKSHGLYRRWYRDKPDQLREEKHFATGVIHGRSRAWNEDGVVKQDVTYDQGMIPPVRRYTGNGTSGITVHRNERGVSYDGSLFSEDDVRVGMTIDEVVQLLKVDVSEKSGIHFPTYHVDMYLHIAFKDGKVSEVSTGHNGVCLAPQ